MGETPPQIHESLVPTDDAEFELRGPASAVKPMFGYADALVDELRVHVTEDGLEYKVVDSANVAMCELTVPAAVFDTYDVTETTIGLNINSVTSALRAGRQRQDDQIVLSYADEHLSTTVQREYDGSHMDLQTTQATIDPDSIRAEPDIPDNLEESFIATATLSRPMFRDAVETVHAVTDYTRFTPTGDDLRISGESGISSTSVVVRDAATGEPADSLFSLDYIMDLVDALAAVDADEITLHLGDEFPVRVEWTAEWNDAEVSGVWFQAPRIQSD